MTEDFTQAEQYVISDLETLKVIADPLRTQVLQLLLKPKTVKEVAARLEMPATKLYYHVNQLERFGLIGVVETNVVSGIIEKTYQAIARDYCVDDQLFALTQFTDQAVRDILGVIFDGAREEVRRSVAAGLIDLNTPARNAEVMDRVLGRATFSLMPAQFQSYAGRLAALLNEVGEASQENERQKEAKGLELKPYGLAIGFYPMHLIRDEERK